jgi:dTDP-4-dehydrorhamnose reductase
VLGKLLSTKYQVHAAHLNSQAPAFGLPVQFDIRDAEQVVRAFATVRPDCVIHTAALTKPDYCETRPEETRAVNVTGTRNIVEGCKGVGAKLIHISTDLVFDGKKGNYSEDDATQGINEYSRSKIAAERIVLDDSPDAVILRLSVLYGPRHSAHPSFLDEILGRWQCGQAMAFFTDQYRNPTFAPQVAHAVEQILAQPRVHGLFHLGGADRLSRYEFALIVARLLGAQARLIGRASMFDHTGPAARPQDCSLVSEKIGRVLGLVPLGCAEGLSEMLRERQLARLTQEITDFDSDT